jgi:hypothetical protein
MKLQACYQFPYSWLLLGIVFTSAHGQSKVAKSASTTRSVVCTEPQSSEACMSFKQLVEAHDKDVLDRISLPTSYVCFRSDEDAFVIFHLGTAPKSGWKDYHDDAGERPEIKSTFSLTEYRDGVFYSFKAASDYWRRFRADEEPTVNTEVTEGQAKGLKVTADETEISIEYPFENQNSGRTLYSLTIRRSTGRFSERFESGASALGKRSSGTCLIYR